MSPRLVFLSLSCPPVGGEEEERTAVKLVEGLEVLEEEVEVFFFFLFSLRETLSRSLFLFFSLDRSETFIRLFFFLFLFSAVMGNTVSHCEPEIVAVRSLSADADDKAADDDEERCFPSSSIHDNGKTAAAVIPRLSPPLSLLASPRRFLDAIKRGTICFLAKA